MTVLSKISFLLGFMTLSMMASASELCHVKVDTSKMSTAVCTTAGASGNNQLLYFTSTSLDADDTAIVFISDRTGDPNLFVRDLQTGKERQLTFNKGGFLKSYVYFDGHPYTGFGKASLSFDARSRQIYYIQGNEIRAVTIDGKERVLNKLPLGEMTAFTHVSADGTRLCVPTTDDRALDGSKQLSGKPTYDIDERVQKENLSSHLHIYDTVTGKQIINERVPKAWITHVQFSPIDHNVILYNNEWPADCGIRRMWLWDGKTHHRLRSEGNGRHRGDWVSHEMWERDGKGIVYHGKYANGSTFIGRVNSDGTGVVEIPLPDSWRRYGHFTVGNRGNLVSDGYYEETKNDAAPNGAGAWISLLKVDWDSRQIQWFPLCRNFSSWDSQDSHPHPIFDHGGNTIYFTSDKTGKRQIYRISAQDLSK